MCTARAPKAPVTSESAKQPRILLPRSYLENNNLAIGGGRIGGNFSGNGEPRVSRGIMDTSGLQIRTL